MSVKSISIAITGAGGAGVMTAGQMLLDAAAAAGWYGLMTRSSGPQIRGGEAAAFLRLSTDPVGCPDDRFDLLFGFDWMNVNRFAAEAPLDANSVIIGDDKAGAPPSAITDSGARVLSVPLSATAKSIDGGRPNMVGLGVLAQLVDLDQQSVDQIIEAALARKGEAVIAASQAAVAAGRQLAAELSVTLSLAPPQAKGKSRWSISGNEAAGLGATRGGVRFVAAYPITPATEILEWLAPNLERVGGTLVQAEDELASINMIIGGSFGGIPALTATAGPGLALMTESLGLAVASETPVLVIDVMRGGPSTGIPTKSEQSDLNIALYGLHGDAPHIVTAPTSIADCLFTTQWTVHLVESLQTAGIMLSDQSLGQARAIIDRPAELAFFAKRETAPAHVVDYNRYQITASGVSPMAIPGTPGGEYVADGLEHTELGRPSSAADDHYQQLDKRARKLEQFDYGNHWAEIEGEGDLAVITWGSSTQPVREACQRLKAQGIDVRLIALRLLMPVQIDKLTAALRGVRQALVVEQTHSKQFFRYLKAEYDLPKEMELSLLNRAGPLPFRPDELVQHILAWR